MGLPERHFMTDEVQSAKASAGSIDLIGFARENKIAGPG
jgi:hypothetical protein